MARYVVLGGRRRGRLDREGLIKNGPSWTQIDKDKRGRAE